MQVNFYVAGSFFAPERVRPVQEELKSYGFSLTFDWTPSTLDPENQDKEAIAELERQAVLTSHFVIALKGGTGTTMEVGAAIFNGIKTYIEDDPKRHYIHNPFCCLEHVIIEERFETLINFICHDFQWSGPADTVSGITGFTCPCCGNVERMRHTNECKLATRMLL